MGTHRYNLGAVSPGNTAHAGLWRDRYIRDQRRDDKKSRHDLVADVAGRPVPDVYRQFYGRWKESLDGRGARTREARVLGRVAVGLGNEGVLETSISLHHTYGVPYIPGSALKGVAARYARERLIDPEWRADGSAYTTVFGTTSVAGHITFFDALYVPRMGGAAREREYPLQPDVLAVHHPDYYQRGTAAPADWDSPSITPFLSATGSYLVALAGPGEWVEATFAILRGALAELGVGAKTSSGYGRLRLADSAQGQASAPTPAGQASAPTPVGQASAALTTGRGQTAATPAPTSPPAPTSDQGGASQAPAGDAPAAAPTPETMTGTVIYKQSTYKQSTPFIRDAEGRELPVNWKALNMNALAGKTAIMFDYVVDANGRRTVVRVTKK